MSELGQHAVHRVRASGLITQRNSRLQGPDSEHAPKLRLIRELNFSVFES